MSATGMRIWVGRGAMGMRGWMIGAGLVLAAALSGCADVPRARSSGVNDVNAQALPGSSEETDVRRRARIRVELGSGYYQQRNMQVALSELQQARQIDPSYVPTYAVLGLVYMDLGERELAQSTFDQGLRLAPDDSDLNNNYGWFLCQTDRAPQAIERFNRALRNPLYQTPARPLRNSGICSLRAGDRVAAEGYFHKALQLDPRDPVALYQLADLNLKRGDFNAARTYQQRLQTGYEPTAEILWLGVRVERAAGHAEVEASLAAQLRRRFPQSRETGLLLSGQYDN